MMKKRLKISKKIYVSPLVEFEEIDAELLDVVIEGSTAPYTPGEGTPDLDALDLDFSMDFVINEVPQE